MELNTEELGTDAKQWVSQMTVTNTYTTIERPPLKLSSCRCGGEAFIGRANVKDDIHIHCTKCAIRYPMYGMEHNENSVNAWNKIMSRRS